MGWDFGVGTCKPLHLEWINNKVQPYIKGNCIQTPGVNHNGKEYKKSVYIVITESHSCIEEISITL